jgi:hypothetical protein
MSGAARVVLVDSVTALGERHVDAVAVTGSHGGAIAARYAAGARVRAAVFNDAGVGLDAAGIAGLALLDVVGMAALAVLHTSARIADALDTMRNGIVGHANETARALGVEPGMTCADALVRLQQAPRPRGLLAPGHDTRRMLGEATRERPAIIGLDSIGLVEAKDDGCVLVIGSHGALHGGDPASALAVDAAAAFFHDAGGGKEGAGFTRLPVLAARGIPAATVDYRTARIGDALSLWRTGVLSRVNEAARARGWRERMSVQRAATIS